MSFIFKDVDILDRDPSMPKVGSGGCVDLIKHYVPGLKGVPTSAWRAGGNVLELGSAVAKGTAIATFVDGQQRNADGSFRNPSDNALAFFVIEQ
jgi:hypothetical protein